MYDKITLSEVEAIAGKGIKKGSEYEFQCPICNDSHKDNLKFNEKKGVLYCFASEEHGKQLCSEILKNREPVKPNENIPQYITDAEPYIQYITSCNNMLLGHFDRIFKELWDTEITTFDNEKVLNYLERERGINRNTVDLTGLGYDFIDNKWVIPVFHNGMCVGMEYRAANFKHKKIWKETDTPKCLANIWGCAKAKILYICEGFLDGYVLLQWLLEKGQTDFAIATPSNGVNSLMTALNQVKFNNYDEIKLILDNDSAGDDATKKALESYPFLIDSRKFLKDSDIKDIGKYYLENVYNKGKFTKNT